MAAPRILSSKARVWGLGPLLLVNPPHLCGRDVLKPRHHQWSLCVLSCMERETLGGTVLAAPDSKLRRVWILQKRLLAVSRVDITFGMKLISHPSKENVKGSHCTSTVVSVMVLKCSPWGVERSGTQQCGWPCHGYPWQDIEHHLGLCLGVLPPHLGCGRQSRSCWKHGGSQVQDWPTLSWPWCCSVLVIPKWT